MDAPAVEAGPQAGNIEDQDDPLLDPEANPIPFDGMRTIHGGFEVLVHA